MTVSGTNSEDGYCSPDEGYRDIDGAQVVLSDDSGKTLAVGTMSGETPKAGETGPGDCVFDFALAPVHLEPNTYYTVEVGRRGKLRYTGQQLTEPLSLTLG
jgi:hypothetical protein